MKRYKLMKSQSMQVNILEAESNFSNKILIRFEKMFIAQAKYTHTSIEKNSRSTKALLTTQL